MLGEGLLMFSLPIVPIKMLMAVLLSLGMKSNPAQFLLANLPLIHFSITFWILNTMKAQKLLNLKWLTVSLFFILALMN